MSKKSEDDKKKLINNFILSLIFLIILFVATVLTDRFHELYQLDFPYLYLLIKFVYITWLLLTILLFIPNLLVPQKIINDNDENSKFFYNIIMQILLAGTATLFVVVSVLWTKRGGKDIEYCVENSLLLFIILAYFMSVMYFGFLSKLKRQMLKNINKKI